jgi:ketosteroid isomerase-like protein
MEALPSGKERVIPPEAEVKRIVRICPSCLIHYDIGNYCRNCGTALVKEEVSQTKDFSLERNSIKNHSNELLRISNEKRKLEACITQLETHRDQVSSNVFTSLIARYRADAEALSSRYEQIKRELNSIQQSASDEIKGLEEELDPIQKRLRELEFLYKSGAIRKPDFLSQKKEIGREIRSRVRILREYRQAIAIPLSHMEANILSLWKRISLFRPPLFILVASFILLMVLGGLTLWKKVLQTSRPASTESAATVEAPLLFGSSAKTHEVEKIKSLLEDIKQANLRKDIQLFMSCYSLDFKDRNGKRLATLESWKAFDYLDLSYDLKRQTISEDTADIRVEWIIDISEKMGGPLQKSKAVLDVLLTREDGRWKIRAIKSAG